MGNRQLSTQHRLRQIDEKEHGWQVVQSRKTNCSMSERRARYGAFKTGGSIQGKGKDIKYVGIRGFASQENEKAYAKAFNERRCLRCLSKDHKRGQCREPVRCFQCNALGHKSGWCRVKERGGSIKEKKREQMHKPRTVDHNTYAQVLSTKQPLLKNRKETELQDKREEEKMEDFWNERPEETNVFVQQRQILRPQNEFLNSTGMIHMMQGAPAPGLQEAIARYFAREFGWNWRDYEVLPVPHGYMLVCLGENLRNRIVWNSPYDIREGIQIGVENWNPGWNMAYNPPPF